MLMLMSMSIRSFIFFWAGWRSITVEPDQSIVPMTSASADLMILLDPSFSSASLHLCIVDQSRFFFCRIFSFSFYIPVHAILVVSYFIFLYIIDHILHLFIFLYMIFYLLYIYAAAAACTFCHCCCTSFICCLLSFAIFCCYRCCLLIGA